MKILSLNLWNNPNQDMDHKFNEIAKFINENKVDMILLQEVFQSKSSEIVFGNIKKDNAIFRINDLLDEPYFYNVDMFKSCYSYYDEGLGVLSKHPIVNAYSTLISRTIHYEDWHKRKLLSVEIDYMGERIGFHNVHFGWTEGNEVFEDQFEHVNKRMKTDSLQFLCGDFNIHSNRAEYQWIKSQNYYSVLELFDEELHHKPTHHRDHKDQEKDGNWHIDYILTNQEVDVVDAKMVFQEETVSDHYGLYSIINIKKQ